MRPCDSCGRPGVLNEDRHCPWCAQLAHEVEAYGTTVAIDLLRTAVLGTRAYATRAQVARAVNEALDAYDA